jgi:hypothetical protein
MKPDEIPALDTVDARVLKSLRNQQRWLRVLTAAAVAFWVLAVIGGVGVFACYTIFYAPKEKQMLRDYEVYGELRNPANGDPDHHNQPAMSTEKALALHFTMNYVMTKGLLAITATVVVLSCGTLTTLLLVVLNRRATLKQINHSLAQISAQLGRLQAG